AFGRVQHVIPESQFPEPPLTIPSGDVCRVRVAIRTNAKERIRRLRDGGAVAAGRSVHVLIVVVERILGLLSSAGVKPERDHCPRVLGNRHRRSLYRATTAERILIA